MKDTVMTLPSMRANALLFSVKSITVIFFVFFFSSRRRHTRYWRDWSSDVCSSDLSRSLSTLRQWFSELVEAMKARFVGEEATSSLVSRKLKLASRHSLVWLWHPLE